MPMLTEKKDMQAALRSKRQPNIARAFCNNMHTRDTRGKKQTRVNQ
jgi:hypothetical protein